MAEDFFELRQSGCNLYAHLPEQEKGWYVAFDENPEIPPIRALGQPLRSILTGVKAYQDAKKFLQGRAIDGVVVNAYFLLGFGYLDTMIRHKGFKEDITQANSKIITFIQPYNIPTQRLWTIDRTGDKLLRYPQYCDSLEKKVDS